MWPFGSKTVKKRLSDLEESTASLRRETREALLEAENLYEKTRTALGRISKRAPAADGEETPVQSPTLPPPVGGDPVSLAIRRRRMGVYRPGGTKVGG
jgi:hypothetical protein